MIADTMVALVGLQRMPNIIPILQKRGNYRCLWLIRSTDADKSGSPLAEAWRNTTYVLNDLLEEVRSGEPAVNAYGISETQRIVAELLNGEPARFIVNFTGGTKCMSIGAYLAAQQAGCTALYVDTANEKLVWFYPDGKISEEEFDLNPFTVRQHLQAYGKRVDEEQTKKHAPSEQALAAGRELVKLWPDCAGVLRELHRRIDDQKLSIDRAKVPSEITAVLEEYGFMQATSEEWELTGQGRKFLTGEWLQAMVYTLLIDNQNFDDVQAGLQLLGSENVKNELDVVATHRGQLTIIECKSGKLAGQEALNKLQAIKAEVGTFVRLFFVSSRESSKIKDDFKARAREYNVQQIITAETLLQVSNKVAGIEKPQHS